MQDRKQALITEQKQIMTPQMYQQIKMLTLPIQDLRLRIQEEIENNPALEAADETLDIPLSELEKENKSEESGDYSDAEYRSGNEDEDLKRKFLEGAVARSESLQEHLLSQLRVQKTDPAIFSAAELLIQNLDEDGFNREKPEDVVKNRDEETIRQAAELVSSFDPQGTCVSDYRESLIVQAKLKGDAPKNTEEIIRNHLSLVERGKYKEMAKILKSDEKTVSETVDFIKSLDPFPGRRFYSGEIVYVIPDLVITRKNSEIVIYLNNEEIPAMRINSDFEKIKKEKNDKETKKFVTSKIREAKSFINIVNIRNRTLLKTAAAIVSCQKAFFTKGPKYLVPLTLKDIADIIGLHETTVSRTASSKYVQTDWGIFGLKYFFSSAVMRVKSSESKEALSKESVKLIIKDIIGANEKSRRLSDQKISDILKKQGIQLARRTVAKYRQELDISPSYER